jgi:hypothetical protein
MDFDEALRLLKGGEEGVEEWNRRLEAGEKILRGADLIEADVGGAALKGADLRMARLGGAYLRAVNLDEANLRKASLDEANLRDAFLRRADLREADVRDAFLREAHLSQANLRGALFQGANLRRADLRGAHLNEAECGETVFADVDLSQVIGLEFVRHFGPSVLSTETLFRSSGTIPEAFLRGCGVAEPLIKSLPSLVGAMSPIQFYSCFISYSSEDTRFAERLHADLQSEGVRCWYAPDDLKTGDRFRDRITEAIRGHDRLMLVLTEHSIASDWVGAEVEAALERESREKRTVLFPIRLDEAVMQSQVGWASLIRQTRQIGDFTDWKNHDAYQKSFNRLLMDFRASEESR